ncbi:MAG: glycosyltransferase [Xenococcaceae cyanobacterium]
MIIALQIVLLFLITASVIFYLGCAICTIRFRGDRASQSSGCEEPASVLIPVYGLDDSAESNWTSFCQQNYEQYEVVFGVMDPQDKAVPVLKKLAANFPDRVRFISGLEVRGPNYHMSNASHLLDAAQHDIVVFTNSDMRVTPDYLCRVTAPLADPNVGVVTCGYIGHTPKVLGAALASLGRCIDFLPSVLIARVLDGRLKFALGATIATRKSILNQFGGLQGEVNRIGSDYHIGQMVSGAGYQIELSDYIVESEGGQESIGQVFKRELRWARTIRINHGFQYYGIVLTYGTIYCLPLLFISGFATWAIIVSLATLTIRIIQVLIAFYKFDGPDLLKWLWALPIRDLMSLIIWMAGAFGQRVYWRGRWLEIGDGGMLTQA